MPRLLVHRPLDGAASVRTRWTLFQLLNIRHLADTRPAFNTYCEIKNLTPPYPTGRHPPPLAPADYGRNRRREQPARRRRNETKWLPLLSSLLFHWVANKQIKLTPNKSKWHKRIKGERKRELRINRNMYDTKAAVKVLTPGITCCIGDVIILNSIGPN